MFLDLSPKIKEIKAKINKWNLIKHKTFCTAKKSTDRTKRQPTEWEKIFANDMTNKGLVPKIYKHDLVLRDGPNPVLEKPLKEIEETGAK